MSIQLICFLPNQKEIKMKRLLPWLKAIFFLVLALSCYSIGGQTGIFAFIILGFVAECSCWLTLNKRKRNKATQAQN